MPDIKTKKTIKDIKSINKSDYLKNMKNTLVKTKENAEKPQSQDYDNPHTYATETMSSKAKEMSSSVTYKVERLGRRSVKKAPKTIRDTKTGAIRIKQKICNLTKNTKIKGTIKTANKTTGKTVSKTVKTSKQIAQATIKTAQATVKASQKAAQAAKVATKVTVQTAKVTAKAVIATIKATIAAVKGLITLIAAGGWIAVVIILIICLVALIAGSCFGIFFSNEDALADNRPLTKIITELNSEFQNKIEQIKTETPHDKIELVSSKAPWKEVLAFYAVKQSFNGSNMNEVVTITQEKAEILRSVFWDMNQITSKTITESYTKTETGEISSVTTLYIIVQMKSCEQMAMQYGFSDNQMVQLQELMKPEYDDLWNTLTTDL